VFSENTMDKITWAEAVEKRGMVIKRIHNTTDYYDTAAAWLASNWCPDCAVTAITPAQMEQERKPDNSQCTTP